MIKEFRDFINRGNLVDIAVAFVMGVAFAAVVQSLTDDIVNPLVAKIFTLEDLVNWAPGGVRIGAFVVAVVNFVIVALVMFLVVRAYNRMRARQEEAAPSAPGEEVVLLRQIAENTSR